MGIVSLGLGGVGSGLHSASTASLELNHHYITLQRLPTIFDGLRIGIISDLHSSSMVGSAMLKRALALVKESNPDMIVLLGDYISSSLDRFTQKYKKINSEHTNDFLKVFRDISAPMGVYAVLGNHDFWSGRAAVEMLVKGLPNAKWLRNEGIVIMQGGEHLMIAGVDDYWHSYSLERALGKSDVCKVLLSHNPDVNMDIDRKGRHVDLVLSGHTHGGQIVLPFVGALFLPVKTGRRYQEGIVQDGQRLTFVSRGVGTVILPFRLKCPPEVSVLTLRSVKRATGKT
ncbi:MAG TPA: metallophosphoesterase [Nitrospirae bacterium]|nr:metallophosphoesterase [Nitrospirota bacterium]